MNSTFKHVATVSIQSLQESAADVFTVNCSSSGSPPTNVTWIKDGQVLTSNETVAMVQYLRDGVTAAYDSLLRVSMPPSDVIGSYACSIDNLISQPTEETLSLQGR